MAHQTELSNSLTRFESLLNYSLHTESLYDYSKRYLSDKNMNLWGMLTHEMHFNFHIFRSLNERVCESDLPEFSPMKQVWNRFYTAIQSGDRDKIGVSYEEFRQTFKNRNGIGDDFLETDLIPFHVDGATPLPFNGIRTSEIAHLHQQYGKFKSLIEYDLSFKKGFNQKKFADQIDRDIKKLVSIPLGRELIDRILAKAAPSTKIVIRLSDSFKHRRLDKNTHQIRYMLSPPYTYQEFPVGLKSVSDPPCIFLAHELLHMLHRLEETYHHNINPALNRTLDKSEEEKHVIRNVRCCDLHLLDPCNEENLRMQLGLKIRKIHIGGSRPTDSLDLVYRNACFVGAYREALAAIKKGVAVEMIVQCAQRYTHRASLRGKEEKKRRLL